MIDATSALNFAKVAALKVGEGLIERQISSEKLKDKRNKTIQVDSDIWAHNVYAESIAKEFPGHVIISEENENIIEITDDNYYWIIDPLDGTTNYRNKSDIFGTSIALYKGSEPVLGVIYLPKLDKLYAELSGQVIPGHPRSTDDLSRHEAVFDRGNMRNDEEVNKLANINSSLLNSTRTIRMFGSASYSLLALCEGYDSFIGCRMALYDVAAGVIFAKNRGLELFQFDGSDYSATSFSDLVICSSTNKEKYVTLLSH
jgi:myo-inositol-1(or 4)-monophosphatase